MKILRNIFVKKRRILNNNRHLMTANNFFKTSNQLDKFFSITKINSIIFQKNYGITQFPIKNALNR